jgi:low affinity Fe/Cu permease
VTGAVAGHSRGVALPSTREGSPTPAGQDDQHWRRGLIRGSGARTPLDAARAERTWTSRTLHRVGEWTAHAWAGLVVATAVVAWVGLGIVVAFPTWWQATLYSVSSAVTLIMVFALQHTQTRQQSATQRKLDELLRSQPHADGELIAVEEAPDEELAALADKNLEERHAAVVHRHD